MGERELSLVDPFVKDVFITPIIKSHAKESWKPILSDVSIIMINL